MKEIQVIKYKDERIKVPFYLKKWFICLVVSVMILLLIGFIIYVFLSIMSYIGSTYVTSYSNLRDRLTSVSLSLLQIDLEMKQAVYKKSLKTIDEVLVLNQTIFSVITSSTISLQLYSNAYFRNSVAMYKDRTKTDLAIYTLLKSQNFLGAENIIFSKGYQDNITILNQSMGNSTYETEKTLESVNYANIAFQIITFLISICIIPFLLGGIIFLMSSQLIYVRKINSQYLTKFKRINELLLLDTFNNISIFSKFVEYCQLENLQNHVYFWKDLQKYKNISFLEEDLKKKELSMLYDKYLKKESEFDIKLTDEELEPIFVNLNTPSESMFEPIENRIKETLLTAHKKFKSSI
jgi:hypothetical protein